MRDAYERDGYLVVPGALDEAVLEAMRALVEGQVDDYARELQRRGKVTDLKRGLPFARRLAVLLDGTGITLRKWNSFLFCREVYDIVTSPRLVKALTAVLGPEVRFHGDYQLTPKLPGSELQAFPWHQDTLYYGRPSQHLHIVTVWLPLVEASEENGCLQLLPGSHRWGLLEGVRGADMNVHPVEDVAARGTPVAVPMSPGDVILMSNLTFHASHVNRTGEVRWSMDLGFSATPGDEPVAPEVRASRDFIDKALRIGDRTPLQVASADPSRVESFADWERRHRSA